MCDSLKNNFKINLLSIKVKMYIHFSADITENEDDRLTQPYGDPEPVATPSYADADDLAIEEAEDSEDDDDDFNDNDSDNSYNPSECGDEEKADESTLETGQNRMSSMVSNRFVPMDSDDVMDFVEKQKNKNTKRKTESNMLLLKRFLLTRGERRAAHEIPPRDLNDYLAVFFCMCPKRTTA